MVRYCQRWNYESRLHYLGFTTLEDRRCRGDMLEVFKMVRGFNKIDPKLFFKFSASSFTRGHTFKLEKPRARLEIRRNFFTHRVVSQWNKLPQAVVEAKTVNEF